MELSIFFAIWSTNQIEPKVYYLLDNLWLLIRTMILICDIFLLCELKGKVSSPWDKIVNVFKDSPNICGPKYLLMFFILLKEISICHRFTGMIYFANRMKFTNILIVKYRKLFYILSFFRNGIPVNACNFLYNKSYT